MKLLIVAVTLVALVGAERDLSKFTPKHPTVIPNRPPPKVTRIVNGQEATPHQFSYMAALFINWYFCGGSILSSKRVLTAAHCCDGAISIKVVVGGHDITQDEPTQQSILSASIEVHEEWDPFNIANDVCVIVLSEEININGQTTSTIPLYDKDDLLEGEEAVVSGWGKPSESSSGLSPVLRYVYENIISNQVCKNYFGSIRDTHICVDGSKGKSACSGDSGGPLVVDGKEVGIFSFGSAAGCDKGYPSAYARVSSFRDWINSKM